MITSTKCSCCSPNLNTLYPPPPLSTPVKNSPKKQLPVSSSIRADSLKIYAFIKEETNLLNLLRLSVHLSECNYNVQEHSSRGMLDRCLESERVKYSKLRGTPKEIIPFIINSFILNKLDSIANLIVYYLDPKNPQLLNTRTFSILTHQLHILIKCGQILNSYDIDNHGTMSYQPLGKSHSIQLPCKYLQLDILIHRIVKTAPTLLSSYPPRNGYRHPFIVYCKEGLQILALSQDPIGRGGYGRVYKAVDLITKEERAFKLSISPYPDEGDRKECDIDSLGTLFIRYEFQFLTAQQCPHMLPPPRMLFEQEQRSCVVSGYDMPLYPSDLEKFSYDPKVPLDTRLSVALELCKKYEDVLKAEYILGDVSPKNVLIEEEDNKLGRLVFCDNSQTRTFLALRLTTSTPLQTPLYSCFALEYECDYYLNSVYRDRNKFCELYLKKEQFSIACVCFYILAGNHDPYPMMKSKPFFDLTKPFRKHFLIRYSKQLGDAFAKILHPDWKKRTPLSDLAKALEAEAAIQKKKPSK